MSLFMLVALAIGTIAVLIVLFTRHAQHFGATLEERSMAMPGDTYLDGAPRPTLAMTRAVTIEAPSETVWPWLAQLGRGAGWYSYDRLDNGSRSSARHIVSWIPPPQLGDASPIGYLRRVVPRSGLTWWLEDGRFGGSSVRFVVDMRLSGDGDDSRLIIRNSADATGGFPRLILWTFQFIDGVMARRQILSIKARAERYATRTLDPSRPETGRRNQYQHYEVIYASGERAGTPGIEQAQVSHQAAVEAGLATVSAGQREE